jgi:hypothetical protein
MRSHLLRKIYFNGKQLNYQSKQELNKIAAILDANKAIEFEIIGHVCCTPVITLTQSIGKLRSDGYL